MSAPDFFGAKGSPRRAELAKLRAEMIANPDIIEAADKLVRSILRAMPPTMTWKSRSWPAGQTTSTRRTDKE
jgi:hypothetical protein